MSRRPPFRVMWEGEWNDIVCADYPMTPERYIRETMHPLLNTDVDCLVYNVASSDAYCAELLLIVGQVVERDGVGQGQRGSVYESSPQHQRPQALKAGGLRGEVHENGACYVQDADDVLHREPAVSKLPADEGRDDAGEVEQAVDGPFRLGAEAQLVHVGRQDGGPRTPDCVLQEHHDAQAQQQRRWQAAQRPYIQRGADGVFISRHRWIRRHVLLN